MNIPVTVLMSVYKNTDPNEFERAILSVTIEQTYKPNQVVLVIDGAISCDLQKKIRQIQELISCDFDIIQLCKNQGLPTALNTGIEHCNNELIARMDDDDISVPNRLQLQYNYMQSHPEIQALGGQITGWSQDLSKCYLKKFLPTDFKTLNHFAQRRCPFNHPTVMFRKSTILKVGAYPKMHPEDYLLWVKLLQSGYIIENLPNVIVKMRLEKAIKSRRGRTVLPGEIKLFKELLSLGFISKSQFIFNVFSRVILRTLPSSIRFLLYRILS